MFQSRTIMKIIRFFKLVVILRMFLLLYNYELTEIEMKFKIQICFILNLQYSFFNTRKERSVHVETNRYFIKGTIEMY